MKNLIAALMVLGLVGCSGLDLSSMPRFDQKTADAKWNEIIPEVEQMVSTVMFALQFAGKIDESEKSKILSLFEEMNYFKNAAGVQIYHGDYDGAKSSASKVRSAGEKILDIVMKSLPMEGDSI